MGEKLAEYIIGVMLFAWFLTWFGFDEIFVIGFKELFGAIVTTASYYLIFFIVGVLLGIVGFLKNEKNDFLAVDEEADSQQN